MRVLDLFSGIGGFSLGLERAGLSTVAFCETDAFCQRVLRKHWPNVPIHPDIRELDGEQYRGAIDVVCGGFPCQDASVANSSGIGIGGSKTGLYYELVRIVRDSGARWVILENVPGLLARGFGEVLRELAQSGYGCWWDCIPASSVGAPHQRDRLWVVAYRPDGGSIYHGWANRISQEVADALANANDPRRQEQWGAESKGSQYATLECDGRWSATPRVCRVDDGIPRRVDRLRALGNAVVPQIPEMIGRAILECRG